MRGIQRNLNLSVGGVCLWIRRRGRRRAAGEEPVKGAQGGGVGSEVGGGGGRDGEARMGDRSCFASFKSSSSFPGATCVSGRPRLVHGMASQTVRYLDAAVAGLSPVHDWLMECWGGGEFLGSCTAESRAGYFLIPSRRMGVLWSEVKNKRTPESCF